MDTLTGSRRNHTRQRAPCEGQSLCRFERLKWNLDWQDVDLGRRYLLVRRGKNGEQRHVRLNSIALKALTDLQKVGGSGPVIKSRAGEALLGPASLVREALTLAKIENFHWHDLRHTFASRLAMAGACIRTIQEALGHKSIAMTVRYSHLSPDFVQDVVDKLAPQPAEESANPSDTRTDTEDLASVKPPTESVH